MEGTFCSWLEKLAWLLVHKTLKSRKGSAFDSLPIHCTVLSGQGNNAILLGRGTLFTTPFPIKGYSCVRVFVRETSEILFRGNIYSYIFRRDNTAPSNFNLRQPREVKLIHSCDRKLLLKDFPGLIYLNFLIKLFA